MLRRLSVLACLFLLAGCQRVNVEKTVTLTGPFDYLAPAVLEGPKSEQKIKVDFVSTEAPMDILVILGNDENAVLRDLQRPDAKLEIVASQRKTKEGSLEATIPAGKDYGVYLCNAEKKTQVTIKLKSQ